MQPQPQQQQAPAGLALALVGACPQPPPHGMRAGMLQPHQRQQCRQRRPPGALLLASINSSITQQLLQQHEPCRRPHHEQPAGRAWAWAWSGAGADWREPAAATFCELDSDGFGGGRRSAADLLTGAPNELAAVALVPPPGAAAGPDAPGKQPALVGSSPSRFELPSAHQQQQQAPEWEQQQQQQPPPGACAVFASPHGSSLQQQQQQRGCGPLLGEAGPFTDRGLGLRALGRAINGEAGKLLGVLGAQLLMHVANLQRGMATLQQHQQGTEQQQEAQQRPVLGWRPRLPWQRQPSSAAGEGAAAAGRQAAAWQASEAVRQWVSRGAAAEARMDLREALSCYTNAVTLDPGDVELICRLAKQWSDLTYEEGATVEQIQEVNGKAMEYAERAIVMAPKAAGGYMASCVSRGRLALFSDNKTKVRLAKEAQEAARTALALEPANDLAHHLMGRWHFEMAQINFVVRQLIRLVYGAALAPGKFEDALTEFEAAVALNPHKLIHRVELGRTHLRLGHKREAYEHLSASLRMEVEDVNAKLQREDAELLLDKLKGEFKVSWGGFTSPGIAANDGGSGGGGSSGGGTTGGPQA